MATPYTIKYGDTLSALATKNKTTVAELQRINKITDPNKIIAGQTLNFTEAPAVGSPTTPPNTDINSPITSSDLEKATTLPDPAALADSQKQPTLSSKVSNVAKTVFTGNQLAVDNLRKEQADILATEKAAAQKNVDATAAEINKITNSTQLQDALTASNKKFEVEQKMQQLTDINSKIASAQDALNIGLVYEQDRPSRLQLISGRMNTLKAQGLATIGALQGTASVIQGNLNLAKAYTEETLNAIKDDSARSLTALNTLLNLNSSKLVDLTKEERDSVDARIKSLDDQLKEIDNNKDDVLGFMTSFPTEFLKAGVTLLDTKAQALQKMLPYLSEAAKLKLAKANAGTGVKTNTPADKALLLGGKRNGMPYTEAILAFGDTLSIDYINSIYPEEAKRASTIADPEKAITASYYDQYIDKETGNIKSGFEVSIDPKNGRPLVKETAKEKKWWRWD